jgi:hypothetical protein
VKWVTIASTNASAERAMSAFGRLLMVPPR